MHITNGIGRAPRWRALVLAIVFLATFYGNWSPASASALTSTSQYTLLATRTSSVAASAADEPVPAPPEVSAGRTRYFSQTAHFLRGPFLAFWESHGATPVLGLPLTEPLNEDGLIVQYLERARLEWHPENAEARNQVQLTRLGAISIEQRGLIFPPGAASENTPTSAYFLETQHTLANAFLSYWLRNGGLAVFGYPLSDEITETNQADGKSYTVQYFERNRFEWHPENPPAYNVQLGLLGAEYARAVSLNPLARVLLPAPVQGGDQDLSDSPRLADLVDSDLLPVVQALGKTAQFRWVPAIIIENNITVEFAPVDEQGVAGAFMTTRSRTRPYLIVVPDTERGESLQSLASVLAHEATHAFDVTSGVVSSRLRCSVEEELRAYMNGLSAWVLLKGQDALDQSYDAGSLDAAVNRSVKGFNSRKPQLDFDFNPQEGRQFLRTLYGDSCGA